jgi:ferrous iron transport protein B
MATDKSGSNPWLVGFGRSLTPLFAPMGIKEDNWPATVGLVTGILAKEVVVGTLSSLYSRSSDPVEGQEILTNEGSLGTMAERFGSRAAAFAYLLFILLYFPCVSVLAVIARELNPKWALFSVIWTTSIAYLVATLFYQAATFRSTPVASMLWITGIMSVLVGSFYGVRQWIHSKTYARRALPTRIVLAPDPLE